MSWGFLPVLKLWGTELRIHSDLWWFAAIIAAIYNWAKALVYHHAEFTVKGTVHPKHPQAKVVLFISLDCFGVSCLVLEISGVEILV